MESAAKKNKAEEKYKKLFYTSNVLKSARASITQLLFNISIADDSILDTNVSENWNNIRWDMLIRKRFEEIKDIENDIRGIA